MTIALGKMHKYLGMIIEYYLPVKLILTMVNYVKNMLDDIPEDIRGG